MEKRERVIKLAKEIEALRANLKRAEADLDSIIGTSETASPNNKGTVVGSLPTQIINFLRENPGQAFNAAGIAEALGYTNMPTLRSTLTRLVNKERITKGRQRGTYVTTESESETN